MDGILDFSSTRLVPCTGSCNKLLLGPDEAWTKFFPTGTCGMTTLLMFAGLLSSLAFLSNGNCPCWFEARHKSSGFLLPWPSSVSIFTTADCKGCGALVSLFGQGVVFWPYKQLSISSFDASVEFIELHSSSMVSKVFIHSVTLFIGLTLSTVLAASLK